MRYSFIIFSTIITILLSDTYAQNSSVAVIKKYSPDADILEAFEQWEQHFEKDSVNLDITQDGIIIMDAILLTSQEKSILEYFIKTSVDFIKLSLEHYKKAKISSEQFTQNYMLAISTYDKLSSIEIPKKESKKCYEKKIEIGKLFLDSNIQNCMIINSIENEK